MPDNGEILKRLKKIDRSYLGAIDGTDPYICEYAGKAPLSKVLKGKVSHWYWKTVSANDVERSEIICLIFIKYIDLNTSIRNIVGRMAINQQKEDREIVVASAQGLMINDVLFLNDKYRTGDGFFDLTTHDQMNIRHLGQTVEGFSIRTYFNLNYCSYYCSF